MSEAVDDTLAAPPATGPGRDRTPGPGRSSSNPALATPTVDLRAGAASPPVEGFPVPDWDRYRAIRVLGEGGMGRVFLARDLRLGRDVAIKFVRGDDPDWARRIVGEARAQARVNDDHVCRVYDVDEVDGRIYIAMQFVDGQALSDLVHALTYEQKALVMRGAALGVHAAHRAGIIHRDLKPTNIMVEGVADGALRPFVMDFGIARDWSAGDTATGTVLGTPQFMAPEQARGEVKQLDRRADVYSLGATMYAFLVGRAPIDGENPLVILNRLSLDEAPRLRTIDRDIPPDLEAIVMKCLEKERAARYESARALADDLGRFLDGQPVAARSQVSLSYRLWRAARKHWRPLAVAAVVFTLAVAALGLVWRERRQAGERAAFARRFAERAERIEALARYSALAPAHDIRNDRAQIRAHMDALRAEIRAGGAGARPAGRYALGRGYLALGDDELALTELQAAWDGGLRDGRVAYALAIAHGRLYQRGLNELVHTLASRRGPRRRALEVAHRDPALALLRRIDRDPDGVSPRYVAALVAFYEERYHDALTELDAIDLTAGGMASFYEAPLLRGQVLHARGVDANAVDDMVAARAALATAATIAESEPAVQDAIADLEYGALVLARYREGDAAVPFERGVAAARRALELEPDDVDVLRQRARLTRAFAEARSSRGDDITALLAQARADATRAVETAPEHSETLTLLVMIDSLEGQVELDQGRDPRPALTRALAHGDRIPVAARSADYWFAIGVAHTAWATYDDQLETPGSTHRDQAIAAFDAARSFDDQRADVWLNLGTSYLLRAERGVGAAADDDLARAIAALDRGGGIDPENIALYLSRGDAYALAAARREAGGGDARADRDRAIAAYREGLRRQPDEPLLHNALSIELAAQARDGWDRGIDPLPDFAAAIAAAERAVAIAPEQPNGHNNLGDAHLERGRHVAALGGDAGADLAAAEAEFSAVLAVAPDHPVLLRNLASTHLLRATVALAARRDPTGHVAAADGLLARVFTQVPGNPTALALRGEALSITAAWARRRGSERATTRAAALAAFAEAVAAAPETLALALAYARACRDAADDPGVPVAAAASAVATGLAQVDRALAARPTWPEAQLVRAGLLTARAERAGATGRDDAATAVAAFEAVLASHPLRRAAWSAELDRARALAR